ncbi:MAG: J domain-containing protein [Cyanobacteria bacterium J06641_5]
MAKRKPKNLSTKKSAISALARVPPHEQLASLQERRQWLLKQIKRKRTELDNFLTQMRSLASEMFQHMAPVFEKLDAIDNQIHELFAEILSKRKLGKKSRAQIEGIYRNMQFSGVVSPRSSAGEAESQVEDEGEPEDFFAFGADANSERTAADRASRPPSHSGREAPEARSIRQTFLRLASVFHPDRAAGEDARNHNAEIMKEINRAYSDGDFARLIELERQHDRGDTDAIATEALDDVDRQCQRLERENATLAEQYEGIKAELRMLRNETHEGEMVATYRRAKREGVDFFEELVAVAESELAEIECVRDFVRDFRDRKMTIKEFLRGPGRAAAAEYIDDLIAAGVPPALAANMPPEMAQMIIESGVRVNIMPGLFDDEL